MKLKLQNTEVTSYEHRTQNICTQNTICITEVWEGKPSETDSIKFKISSKTPRRKKDSTKDTSIDITSDSQMNSNFPYRWSPASLTFNNYFTYFYIYI